MDELNHTVGQRYEQRLRAQPAAITLVRLIVCAQVRLWGRESVADAAGLCVTELLTNVSKHVASDHCSLRVENGHDAVCMTVADSTEELPVLREPDCLSETGRGMRLITRVADAWGVRVVHRGGKEVWVELREPASSLPVPG